MIKLQFEVIIRKLFLKNTPDDVNFQVLWVRGGKKIDTRCKSSADGTVKIGDKFQMKTSLEFDTLTNQFVNKPVSVTDYLLNQTNWFLAFLLHSRNCK